MPGIAWRLAWAFMSLRVRIFLMLACWGLACCVEGFCFVAQGTGNDGLNWPHRDGLNWPHLRPIVA
jgi:hypothetical protein